MSAVQVRKIVLTAVLALLAGGATLAAAASQPDGVVSAQLAAPAAPADQPPATSERDVLIRRFMTFVVDDYLGTGRDDHENRADLYAGTVDYYGRARLSRDGVMAGKRAYYRKWPIRRYDMIAGSLKARPGTDDSVEITFRYNYSVANGARSAHGIGTTTLGLVLADDGRYQIVKETGGVVQRFGRD